MDNHYKKSIKDLEEFARKIRPLIIPNLPWCEVIRQHNKTEQHVARLLRDYTYKLINEYHKNTITYY